MASPSSPTSVSRGGDNVVVNDVVDVVVDDVDDDDDEGVVLPSVASEMQRGGVERVDDLDDDDEFGKTIWNEKAGYQFLRYIILKGATKI